MNVKETRSMMARLVVSAFTAMILVSGAARAEPNDYPTAARADYVFACMATNGQTREMLERCSCSIDVIAGVIPYQRYVEAETILRMRMVSGEKSAGFKRMAAYRTLVDNLRNAQAEAEIRCF